ncbi:MAG: LptA/OstA family protein [Opitutaceae bacterium]|nr:LptA/OstA family protein [Opitutaceae bacterium]
MKPDLRTLFLLIVLPAASLKGAPDVPPTVIESTSLEMRSTDAEITAVFDQNVVVTGNNLRISCDHLEVVATRIGDATETVGKPDKFRSLIAMGRVHIVQGDREVTCGRAEVFPGDEKIILTENPVVIDKSGPYVASGTRIVLLRGERRLFGDNIKLTGPGLKDLGFDKDAPMKTPAPEPAEKK